MKMRSTAVILLAIVLGVVAYAITGYLARDGHQQPRLLEGRSLAARLQLTAEQLRRIEEINVEFQPQREEIRERRREHLRELMRLLRESPPGRQRIDEKIDEISSVVAEMQRLAVDHMLDVSAELDEEQRERLFELTGEAMCPGAMMGRGHDGG